MAVRLLRLKDLEETVNNPEETNVVYIGDLSIQKGIWNLLPSDFACPFPNEKRYKYEIKLLGDVSLLRSLASLDHPTFVCNCETTEDCHGEVLTRYYESLHGTETWDAKSLLFAASSISKKFPPPQTPMYRKAKEPIRYQHPFGSPVARKIEFETISA